MYRERDVIIYIYIYIIYVLIQSCSEDLAVDDCATPEEAPDSPDTIYSML